MQGVDCYKHIERADDLTAFVLTYGPLVKRIANHLKCRLPDTVELDDLLQAGLIGLLEARSQYIKEAGASFETYASIKIRGAMIDEVRKATGITRDLSQHMKTISSAKSNIENKFQDTPITGRAIADELGISEKRYSNIMAQIQAYQLVSMGDVATLDDVPCTAFRDPARTTEDDDIKHTLKAYIKNLPKREQQILALYYNEELSFKEIADILNLTEARISQLHGLVLQKIKQRCPVAV